MSYNPSIATMIEQLSACLQLNEEDDTLNDWERKFLRSIIKQTPHRDTTRLSIKQVDIIEQMWKRRYA